MLTAKFLGLKIVGAECRAGNKINLTDEVQTSLDRVHFSWKLDASAGKSVSLPVYLYPDRRNLLFTFDFVPSNFEKSLLYERGVAVIGNELL